MEIRKTELDLIGKNLVGFDYKSENEFIGITKSNEIITPFSNLEIKINIRFPIIRIIDEDLFLVADSRTKRGIKNCFVFNYEGKLTNKFYFGDGIQDIKVIKNKIIVSYFDEGVLGDEGPNNNGLSIFNLKEKLLFGYNSKHGNMEIMDCYCMSKIDNQRIVFLAYTDFNLIELNIITHKEKIHEIPPILRGSNGMTTWKDKIYFHAPYKDKEGIFEWELTDKNTTKIGNHKGYLRGIEHGRFLSFENKSYTIVEMR